MDNPFTRTVERLTPTTRGGRKKALILGGAAVVALIAVAAPDSDDEPDTGDMEYAAFDVCTQFVKDRLKAPGTAEFRNFYEDDGEVVVTPAGTARYIVRSTVDSENGFGALLRTEFVCQVAQARDGRWQLANLDMDE